MLADVAGGVGLDAAKAREILASDTYVDEVRADENLWRSRGISAVPSVIINQRWLIQGGQPPEVFEHALRQVVNGTATEAQ